MYVLFDDLVGDLRQLEWHLEAEARYVATWLRQARDSGRAWLKRAPAPAGRSKVAAQKIIVDIEMESN
jgi:hypothetical protein